MKATGNRFRKCSQSNSRQFSKIIVIVLLLLASCQFYDMEHWPVTYPEAIAQDMELFFDYAPSDIQVKSLKIELRGELYSGGRRVVGLCKYAEQAILLDTTSGMWKYSRTKLVMHELGHYTMHRQHEKDTTTLFETWKGYPVSFMNTACDRPTNWNLRSPELQEYYMNELFSKR